jgi:uncharacterized protein involved in outer membrane biogenesis
MAAALDGDAALLMRGGEASTLQLVLTNLDLARAAALLLRGDEAAEIRCAVAAVHVQQGILKPDFLVIDTSAVVISGEGSVDLRNEKFDLELTAKSKQPSLLALRGRSSSTGRSHIRMRIRRWGRWACALAQQWASGRCRRRSRYCR